MTEEDCLKEAEKSIESDYKIVFLKDQSQVDIVNKTVIVNFEDKVNKELKIRRLLISELRNRTAFTGPRDAII